MSDDKDNKPVESTRPAPSRNAGEKPDHAANIPAGNAAIRLRYNGIKATVGRALDAAYSGKVIESAASNFLSPAAAKAVTAIANSGPGAQFIDYTTKVFATTAALYANDNINRMIARNGGPAYHSTGAKDYLARQFNRFPSFKEISLVGRAALAGVNNAARYGVSAAYGFVSSAAITARNVAFGSSSTPGLVMPASTGLAQGDGAQRLVARQLNAAVHNATFDFSSPSDSTKTTGYASTTTQAERNAAAALSPRDAAHRAANTRAAIIRSKDAASPSRGRNRDLEKGRDGRV